MLFVSKVLCGLGPSYLSDILSLIVPDRLLRSVEQMVPAVPKSRLKQRGDWAFAIAALKLWNKLSLHIRTSPTETLLKPI